jgi:CRISPR-associated protein Csh1
MVYLLSFLEKLEVIKMNPGDNFVSKYLEEHKGLKPLNDFFSTESKGLDTKEKQYAFLVGLLFGKLVSVQQARGVSANALKWLKGLQLSQQDLMDIFVKTRSKLDDYSTPKNAWSNEMKGVSEAIAALGANISNWDICRKEIPYYLCLGQSLSGYYLPSKSNANQTDEMKGGI